MVMVSTTKALVAFFLVGLLLNTLGPRDVMSYSVTDIDGSSTMNLVFDKAGETVVNLSIPRPFKALMAQMNITGSPSVTGGTLYPTNVSVDVGSDGKVEWAFNGTGYGPLGRQDRFRDGSIMKELTVANSANKDFELLIPKGATIISAGITVEGVPTPMEHYSSIITNETLEKLSHKNYAVPGIDPQDIAINSSVALKDVVVLQNKVDVNQSRSTTTSGLMTNFQVAQTFQVNRTDPRQKTVRLNAIAVSFGALSTSNINLDLIIYNSSKSSNYKPVGPIVGISYAGESQLKGNYLNFSFNTPLELEPSRVYTMLLGNFITGGNTPYVYIHQASSGTNADSAYPLTDCFFQTSDDGGLTWVTDYLADLTFRTFGDLAHPITKTESSGIMIDGVGPSKTVGTTLYFNQTPRYNSSGWTFSINNSLPMAMLYDMSASLDCNDAPDHVILDVGNDSVAELSINENLTDPIDVSGLDDEMNLAVQTSLGLSKGQSDAFGNLLVPVPVRISALGKGKVRLVNLKIEYNLTVRSPDLKDAIVAYQSLHCVSGIGPLNVPIKVTSSTAGLVHLSSLNFVYDGPPKQVMPIPTGLTLVEEGVNASMMDLTSTFVDDFDSALVLEVQNYTTSSKINGSLNVTIDSALHLSVDARQAINWSGNLTILINATDGSNFTKISDPINITVTNVNDGPVITSIPPTNVSVGKMFRYNYTLVDSDSTSLTVWLEKAPSRMDLDKTNRSISWTPGVTDIGKHTFVLKVSDGTLEAQQNISIIVRSSGGSGTNHAPRVQNITNKTVMVGDNLTVQVTAYDPDQDLIEFTLVNGPTNLTINATTGTMAWQPDKVGSYIVTIRVSDGDLQADISFNIAVLDRSTEKPTVSIDRPLSGEKISGVLTLLGKASVKGSKLIKVEYNFDGGQWYSADLQPDGSWSAEASMKDLSKGNHTLVVKATDAKGMMNQTYTTFELKGRPSSHTSSGLLGLLPYLLILMIVIVVIVLAIAWAKHRSKGGRYTKVAKTEGSKTKSDGKNKAGGAVSRSESRSSVDSGFLVYHDGRLITYASRSEIADLDATLQVIKDFVKASFRGDVGRLDALKYENMNIILERGIQMYLVVITPENDDLALQSLRRKMRSFLGEVHDRYKHILKVWDGKYKSVQPIEKMVNEYVKGKGPSEDKVIKSDEKDDAPPEEQKADPKEEKETKRWDESPDLEDKGLSKIEKQKLLQDRLTRGEISEKEFDRLTEKL
jgi:hypothetical protein